MEGDQGKMSSNSFRFCLCTNVYGLVVTSEAHSINNNSLRSLDYANRLVKNPSVTITLTSFFFFFFFFDER